MQDAYVGDIGDYGKYGLLRNIGNTSLYLAINWYKVKPARVDKQNNENCFKYLNRPEIYRKYDSELFDELFRIAIKEQRRKIEEVEAIDIGADCFFSEEIPEKRETWHNRGLSKTQKADIVFLDPDNGLATKKMMENGRIYVNELPFSRFSLSLKQTLSVRGRIYDRTVIYLDFL